MWADLAPRPAVAGVAAVGAAVASVAVASVAVASRPLGRPARAWPVCHHAPRGAKAHAPRGAWWQTAHGGGMGCAHLLGLMGSPISPMYLPYISAVSPLYLPCISPVSPLHLALRAPLGLDGQRAKELHRLRVGNGGEVLL